MGTPGKEVRVAVIGDVTVMIGGVGVEASRSWEGEGVEEGDVG